MRVVPTEILDRVVTNRMMVMGGGGIIGVLVSLFGGYANAIIVLSVMYLFGLYAIWSGRETRGAAETL